VSANGQLPPGELAPIQNGQLANAAAAAWNAMNVKARENGCELRPTGSKSSYRTYAQQVELYAAYLNGTGNLAAKPGTSNHGWGVAVDVASRDMRAMIDRIGEPYGWAKKWSDAPSEWWHIRFERGHYIGPDPGPYGRRQPAPAEAAAYMPLAGPVVANADGRLEVFAAKVGEVRHRWQQAPNGAFAVGWASLGNP
jgi:hypothetical protein